MKAIGRASWSPSHSKGKARLCQVPCQPFWGDRYAPEIDPLSEAESDDEAEEADEEAEAVDIYGIADIIADGGFMAEADLAAWLERLRVKKILSFRGRREQVKLGLPSDWHGL
jgi:hypothetical protein